MAGDLDWLDVDWMRDARRDQAFQAIAESLSVQASAIRSLEESCIKANGGGSWDPSALRRYCALTAAASALTGFFAGARGVALEIANTNKKGGKDYQRMPAWIDALGDQLIGSFVSTFEEIKSKRGGTNAEAYTRVENVA